MKPDKFTKAMITLLLFAPPHAFALELESDVAKMSQVSTTYVLEGLVEAEQNSTVSAQTAGKIQHIYFDVNDYVQKNEVIVEINNEQQASSLKQAEAALKEAVARQQEAQAEFNRVDKVYREQVISKSEFDKARAALKSARARVEAAQAAVSQARQQFEFTLVRAPFSGILTNREVEAGETVDIGTRLVTGLSLEKLRVLTHVPQSILKAVRKHRHAIIITDDSEIISTDMTFFPFADPRSHSFALRVRLPGMNNDLFPGMHVKVAMQVEREQKIVIPFNAVAFRGEVTAVYVQKGEKLYLRHVRLGRRLEQNEVVILSGIDAGERVVSDPVAAAIAIKESVAK